MNEKTQEQQEQGQEQQAQESEKLDMQKYGQMKFESGTNKPFFEKITKMTVKGVEFKKSTKLSQTINKDGETSQYFPVYLSVTFTFYDNGTEKEFYENYGGARLYGHDMDDSKMWLGQDSALGKLHTLMKETSGLFLNIIDIETVLLNKEVGVRTDTLEVMGKTINKNIIKTIYI